MVGFIEYYEMHRRERKFFTLEELPFDAREDLKEMLFNGDKRIGFMMQRYYNNGDLQKVIVAGYYVRRLLPEPIYKYNYVLGFRVIVGFRWWRHKRIYL